MRVKLTIEYDGRNFCGWQTQPGLRSVQSEIEKAIFAATGAKSRITGSGRTDAGVHAVGQVAHFDTEKDLGAKFVGAINFYLPSDVRIKEVEAVSEDFHARFSAKNKTYVYVMYEGNVDSALLSGRATRIMPSDVTAMDEAAKRFLGRHDFCAFMSSGSDTMTTVRTVTRSKVERRDGLILFTVSADGFLYNMVRKMVAALMEVGRGKMSGDDLQKLLIKDAVFTRVAPPYGLYLLRVDYDNSEHMR